MEEIQFNPQQFEIGLFGHNPIQEMSKAQINHLVHLISESVKEGGKDIKSLLAIASKYQLLFAELEKTLKEGAVDELLKYDKSRFEIHNVEMQVAEVGTKYDFSATKQWVDLQDQIDSIKEKQKEVEKFYQQKLEIIDSASVVAQAVSDVLKKKDILNLSKRKPKYSFWVSDYTESFEKSTAIFFNQKLKLVEKRIWKDERY